MSPAPWRTPAPCRRSTFLAKAGRADRNRVLVLRAASNYDQQRPGIGAAESLAETKIGQYGAYLPALEAAWRVGHVVVGELTSHWANYSARPPGKVAIVALFG